MSFLKGLDFNSISTCNYLCVMVDFRHHLGWAMVPGYVVEDYSECFSKVVLG